MGQVVLAPAHLDAHRADPAFPARTGQRAGVGAAAAGHRPTGGTAVLRRAPCAGPLAGQVLAVQRVRCALVRGDLPAAVPLPRRVRGPADVPAGLRGAPAAATGPAEPVPAAAREHHGIAAGRRRRAGCVVSTAGGQAVPGAHRGRLDLGGKGLPAGGRQPAVPPRAAGAAGRGQHGRAVWLQGEPPARRRAVLWKYGDRPGPVPPGTPGIGGGPAAILDRAGLVPRALRLFGAGHGATGRVQCQPQLGAATQHYDLQVNHPLNVDNVKVYLIGHGYAPVFRVTDGTGHVVFNGPVPFIPVAVNSLMSEGVVKVPDARPQQLGFAGVFLPTTVDVGGKLNSAFPAPYRPAVSLVSFAGNLGMNSGVPQSVYQLNTAGLHRLAVQPRPLSPGQSIRLPHGMGTLTFTGYRQWMSLAITYDPGQLPALIAAIAALAGLLVSFLVRRRRVFLRAAPAAGGGSTVEFAGLARTESSETFGAEFAG